MRGKDSAAVRRLVSGRITPAYAGKRDSAAFDTAWKWDHPRLCGEKLRRLALIISGRRITPAYAGKSRP